MNLLATPLGRRVLFACLYLSEGAPIGFIWFALPTQLRAAGVSLAQITALQALALLPWTFKFAWAPLVDLGTGPRWTLRHWIISAQLLMGATLLPLAWLDWREQLALLSVLLFAHALSAATQDVSIDALCISLTDPLERGSLNGWMQAGMLAGRAMMGGGALMLAQWLGTSAIVVLLVAITTGSLLLLAVSPIPPQPQSTPASQDGTARRLPLIGREVLHALAQRSTWIGLLFALIGPAAFKSVEGVFGPFLLDRGFSEARIGSFGASAFILAMIAAAVLGGIWADRMPRRRFVALALLGVAFTVLALAAADRLTQGPSPYLLAILTALAFGIGVFTASMYAMFMDLTRPALAATQFSAFMGATNGCESWSTLAIGRLITNYGYSVAMVVMAGASLLALPLLAWMPVEAKADRAAD